MTNEDTFGALLNLAPVHPMPVGMYLLLAACIFHPGCNERAVRLIKAFQGLFKALRG